MRSSEVSGNGWFLALVFAGFTLSTAGCTAPPPPAPEPQDKLDALLIDAVTANKADVVPDLLRRGANPNVLPRSGSTPLVVAIRQRNRTIVEALLAGGADVNLRRDGFPDGLTPLYVAAAANLPDIMNQMIARGARVNDRTGVAATGTTALETAAADGHATPVVVLLLNGATITPRALGLAIAADHTEVVERLLEAGADPRWTLYGGVTVLEAARKTSPHVRAKMISAVQKALGPPGGGR
jgi:uncharacterized protein